MSIGTEIIMFDDWWVGGYRRRWFRRGYFGYRGYRGYRDSCGWGYRSWW